MKTTVDYDGELSIRGSSGYIIHLTIAEQKRLLKQLPKLIEKCEAARKEWKAKTRKDGR